MHTQRSLLFSHHLLARSKRRALHEWSLGHSLYALAKPGRPGLIVLEGSAEDCRAVIKLVKRLRWQHLYVKYTELDTTAGVRLAQLLPRAGLVEIESMKEFVSRLGPGPW